MAATSKAIRDSTWSGAATAADVFSGLLLILLVGNWVSVPELGGYCLALGIYVLFSAASTLGVDSAAVVLGAPCAGDRARFGAVAGSALKVALASGLVAGLALWAGSVPAAWALRAPSLRVVLPLMAVGVPLAALNKTLWALLNAARRMRAFALCVVLRDAALLGLTWLALRGGWGLWGAAAALPAAEGLAFCALAPLVAWSVTLSGRNRDGCGYGRELVSLGWMTLLAGLVNEAGLRIDVMVLAAFTAESDVAVYSLAVFIARGPLPLLGALQRVTTPVISAYHAAGELRKIEELTRFLARAGTLFMLACAVPISLFYKELVALLYPAKPELAAGADAARLVLAGVVVAAAVSPYGGLFVAARVPRFSTMAAAAQLAGAGGGSLALIPFVGLVGAATGAWLGSVALAGAVFLFARTHLGVRPWSGSLLALWGIGAVGIGAPLLPLPVAARLGVGLAALGAAAAVAARFLRRGIYSTPR